MASFLLFVARMWKVLPVLAVLASCSRVVMTSHRQSDPERCTTSSAPPIVDGLLAVPALAVGVYGFAVTPASTDSDDPLVAGGTAVTQMTTTLIGVAGIVIAATQVVHMRYGIHARERCKRLRSGDGAQGMRTAEK